MTSKRKCSGRAADIAPPIDRSRGARRWLRCKQGSHTRVVCPKIYRLEVARPSLAVHRDHTTLNLALPQPTCPSLSPHVILGVLILHRQVHLAIRRLFRPRCPNSFLPRRRARASSTPPVPATPEPRTTRSPLRHRLDAPFIAESRLNHSFHRRKSPRANSPAPCLTTALTSMLSCSPSPAMRWAAIRRWMTRGTARVPAARRPPVPHLNPPIVTARPKRRPRVAR